MKKLSVFTILFLLIISNVCSQVQKGVIIYKIDNQGSMDNVGKDIDTNLSYMIQLEVDMAKDIELELLFNNKISVFRTKKSLVVHERPEMQDMFDLVKLMASGGVIFTNLSSNKQIKQTKNGGETYNVLSDIEDIKWELTSEQKKIGDFLCYKAKCTKIMFDGIEQSITAWYTPEIPLQFGPKEYAGMLPGLIMELDDTFTKYTCSEIKLNPKKKIDIDWPSESNTITKEEYKKLGSEIYLKQ